MIVNGTPYDFSGIPEGAALPRDAVQCDWLVSEEQRIEGGAASDADAAAWRRCPRKHPVSGIAAGVAGRGDCPAASHMAIAQITGLRRKTQGAILAARTPQEAGEALAALWAEAGALGLASVSVSNFDCAFAP